MDDRQNAAQAMRQTLTKLKQFLAREAPPRLSEADTKANFVERYISALGYEGLEDVVREYYVKNSQEFIDFVLRVNGEQVLAIEAKPLQTELTDKHAAQLVQYCSVEGIEWAVLTNARALWLFNTYLKGDQNQKLVVKLDLLGFNTDPEFDAIFEQVWLLSKSSLSSPTAINSWMEQRRLDQGLRSVLLNPHSDVVRAISAELAKSAGISAHPDTIVQWMRGQLAPNVSVLPPLPRAPVVYEHKEPLPGTGPRYWLLPCGRSEDGAKPVEQLHRWLDKGFWGLYQTTPNRKNLHTGDYICLYANQAGVVATGRVAAPPETPVSESEWPEPYPPSQPVYKLPLRDIAWLPNPRPITRELRMQLEAFREKDLGANPGWFVQTTRALSPHDFELLTASATAWPERAAP